MVRGMRRILAAAVLLAATSACSSNDPEPPAAAPAPVVTTSSAAPTPTVSTNVETDTACKLVEEATRSEWDDQLDDRATIEAIILNAAKSNVEAIKLAGVQMDGRYSAWSRAEAGGGDYAAAVDDLTDAAGRLKAACVDAGVGS